MAATTTDTSNITHGNRTGFATTAIPGIDITDQGFDAMGAILVLAGFMALFGNSTILVVFALNKCLHSPVNLLIASMAGTDFISALLGSILSATSNFSRTWVFGRGGCVLYGFLQSFMGFGSIHHLAAIAVERYVIIVRNELSHCVTYRMAALVAGLCWAFSLFWALLPLFGWSSYTLEGAATSCSVHWESQDAVDMTYNFGILIFCFVIPLACILYAYCNIFRFISKGPINLEKQCERLRRNQRRVALTAFAMIVAYLASWTPYALVSLIVMFQPSIVSAGTTASVAIIAKCAMAWNPVIYTCTNKLYRDCIRSTLCCKSNNQVEHDGAIGVRGRYGSKRNQVTTAPVVSYICSNSSDGGEIAIPAQVNRSSQNGGGEISDHFTQAVTSVQDEASPTTTSGCRQQEGDNEGMPEPSTPSSTLDKTTCVCCIGNKGCLISSALEGFRLSDPTDKAHQKPSHGTRELSVYEVCTDVM